jgi:hypothetical protein
MLIRLERIYVETSVEVNGHTYKRKSIDVLIDFTSKIAARRSVAP